MSNYKKLKEFKIVKTNEMADGDFEKILDIFIEKGHIHIHDNQYLLGSGLEMIGRGANGEVYEFIGSDGYEYAVKVETEYSKESDGKILERLQGIKGYPKLFSYIEGTYEHGVYKSNRIFYIMISQKINGFTLNEAMYGNKSREMLTTFSEKSSSDIFGIFAHTINGAYENDLTPLDVHSGNVMFNVDDGLIYVVDVGNYLSVRDNILALDYDYHKSNSGLERVVRLSSEINTMIEVG